MHKYKVSTAYVILKEKMKEKKRSKLKVKLGKTKGGKKNE